MATETTCTHHWIIATANGKTSEGRCQKCGEVREFLNYIEQGFEGEIIVREGRRQHKQASLRL